MLYIHIVLKYNIQKKFQKDFHSFNTSFVIFLLRVKNYISIFMNMYPC